MLELELTNAERVFLKKLVNAEMSKSQQKGATAKKFTMLYELQSKLKEKSGESSNQEG